MKKIVVLVVLICMVSLCLLPASASGKGTDGLVRLSMLDREELIEFLAGKNAVIPEELKSVDIVAMVASLEADPDLRYVLNDTKAVELIERVRAVVREYYDIPEEEKAQIPSRYTLQYSTVYSWNTNMINYNCYAYALGKNTMCNPGDFSGQQYDSDDSIIELAVKIKADLNGTLGYNCVKTQANRPTTTSGWTNIIAVRKETIYNYLGVKDYHVAKLSSSEWLHKPGLSAVLKFNNAPTNSVEWNNESYDGVMYWGPGIWYDSSIVYLSYKPAHGNTTYEGTGDQYHSGAFHYYEYAYICQDCGCITKTVWVKKACSGPPCATYMGISDFLETA